MAAWTKADFTASYSICPRYEEVLPNGRKRVRRYTEIRLHYHPKVMKPISEQRADKILAAHNITGSDVVVVLGAGFGWLCEALVARTGCACLGVDPSTYILDNKDLSADDELEEAILAAGLDKTTGLGLEIWERFSDPASPRTTANLAGYDITKKGDRNAIERDYGTPTYVITEDIWQILTQGERDAITNEINSWGATPVHFIEGVVT